MKYRITLLTFLVLFSYSGFCQDWKKYPYTPEESLISFPKDEGRHTSEIAEWWYSTGQVTGNTTGNKYSYVVIYFYGPQAGFDGFRLLNIMNEDTGEKYFDSKPISYSKLSTENISWNSDNLDNGNPLLYNIAFNKETFTIVAEGTTDPFFKWENPTFNEGENIWFKITGYSVDKTIAGSVISSMSSSVTLSVETFEKNNLVLYPNPGKNTLKIDFPAMVNSVYYEISDLHGRLILKSEENNTNEVQIDIQNFKSGLYVLKLKNEKKVMHAKFLVE